MNVYVIECILYGDYATSVCVAKSQEEAKEIFTKENSEIVEYIEGIEIIPIKINRNKKSVRNFFGGYK